MKKKVPRSSQSLVQSVLNDIREANPDVPENEIVRFFQEAVAEVIPAAVMRVRLRPVLSPFDFKKREFLFQRSSRSLRQRMEEVGQDPESILRAFQSYFFASESFAEDSSFPNYFSEMESGNPLGETMGWTRNKVSGFTSSLFFPSSMHQRFGLVTGSDQLLGSQSAITSGLKKTSREITDYEIDRELVEERDISMARGRFFSIIERECRRFAESHRSAFQYRLSKSNLSEFSFVLRLRPNWHISLDELHEKAKELERDTKRKVENILDVLRDPEKSEFARLAEGFSVKIDLELTKELPENAQEIVTRNFDSSLEKQSYPQWLLDKLEEKIAKKNRLVLEDVALLASYLDLADKNEQRQLLSWLRKDLKLRKEVYKVDGYKELYRDENELPSSLRLRRTNQSSSTIQQIDEAIMAVTLDEYGKNYRKCSDDFIAGKIGYDDFREQTRKYRKLMYELWPI